MFCETLTAKCQVSNAKSVCCLFETYESESSNFITLVVVHIVAIQK